jgi:hypothetical protein
VFIRLGTPCLAAPFIRPGLGTTKIRKGYTAFLESFLSLDNSGHDDIQVCSSAIN